jgi:hypothetical protein
MNKDVDGRDKPGHNGKNGGHFIVIDDSVSPC